MRGGGGAGERDLLVLAEDGEFGSGETELGVGDGRGKRAG